VRRIRRVIKVEMYIRIY